ncbi:MAG: GNAT family N-acetyltransferase [Caldilineales bacterium]
MLDTHRQLPMLLTLLADTQQPARQAVRLPGGYVLRAMTKADIARCAQLYVAAYPRDIVADLAEAEAEMAATEAGDYGLLALTLSCLVEEEGEPVAALMTVEPAPWPDTPSGPFIIELFTHPVHRRRGLGRAALLWTAQAAQAQGKHTLALRVDAQNAAALRLYTALGFVRWP